MRHFLLVVSLALCGGAVYAGEQPPSPLRLIPAEADLVLHVSRADRLVEAVRHLDLLNQLTTLAAVQEQLDSTSARRLRQLLAYFEKTMGKKWPALVERLTSGGAVLAAKFGSSNRVLLVIQGDDEKLLEKFVATAVTVLEGELARQESKVRIEKGSYHGIPGFKLGDFHVARAGSAVVVANHKDALARALNLHLGKDKKSVLDLPAYAEAGKLLPPNPLVSAWLNMAP